MHMLRREYLKVDIEDVGLVKTEMFRHAVKKVCKNEVT